MSIKFGKLIQFRQQLNQSLKTRNFKNRTYQPNPQVSSERSYGRSVFLTNFDKMQKTRALWRETKLTQRQKPKKKQLTTVSSLVDLNRLKIKYRMQLLKRRSKQDLFQQNINMIMKIQQIPPKVDAWNQYKPNKSKRSSQSSLQKLQLFEKNMQMIRRIQQIQPKIQNWNFYKPKKSIRAEERTRQKLKIFEENMKIIQRVETTVPKVWSWSKAKPRKNKSLIQERILKKQKIFEENMKMIQKVESIPPKVQSWADIKFLQKKVKRLKSYDMYDSQKKLETMKRLIDEAQDKLRSKIQEQKIKNYKTLPSDPSKKYIREIGENKQKLRRMTERIQKTKCAIDCWSKPLTLNFRNERNKNLTSKLNKNSGVISLIKQNQQVKRINFNKINQTIKL